VTSCPIGCYGDGERTLAPITLATIESAWRHADVLGDRFGLVIVDEVHDMGNGVRDEALEMNLAGARLGLTATPARGESQLARLRELVGPVICEMAVRELTGGVLAPLRAMVLTLDLNAEERRRYDELMGLFRAEAAQWRELVDLGAWSDLTRALAQTEDGRKALTAWRQARKLIAFTDSKSVVLGALLACHRDSRTLVFTADNDSAYAVAREHLVMPITCDIGRAERADALAAFERGDLRALVSARVLNEGIDVPAADVAVVVSAGLGEREHVQRVGRLLRPHPGKTAVVYELVARGTFEVAQSRRRRKGIAA
jgi:superfamily II DNA or RNA helicase